MGLVAEHLERAAASGVDAGAFALALEGLGLDRDDDFAAASVGSAEPWGGLFRFDFANDLFHRNLTACRVASRIALLHRRDGLAMAQGADVAEDSRLHGQGGALTPGPSPRGGLCITSRAQ